MYLLVAHATLASCDCPFAQARCHARADAAARVGSSSYCPSVRLKPDDCPPTRARGSAVSVCPAAARLGANQTGGWSE